MALLFRIIGVVTFLFAIYAGYQSLRLIAFHMSINSVALADPTQVLSIVTPPLGNLIISLLCFGLAAMTDRLAETRRYVRWLRWQMLKDATGQSAQQPAYPPDPPYAPPGWSRKRRRNYEQFFDFDDAPAIPASKPFTLPGRNVPLRDIPVSAQRDTRVLPDRRLDD